MVIYKAPNGWLFKYNFQPDNFYYFIDSDNPYYAEAGTMELNMSDYEVEYHTLPPIIQSLIAATQSVLVENTVVEYQQLAEAFEDIQRRDED